MKRWLELTAVASGVPGLKRRLLRGSSLVLAYHAIVPDGARATGDPSLHLPRAAFARQLDELLRTHDVVRLDQLDATRGGRRPGAVITFDDAYHGTITAGVEELVARGLPATIFVAPAYVPGGTFWWDRLGAVDALDGPTRAFLLDALAGDEGEIRRWAHEQGISSVELPAYARCAADDELLAAASRPGITLASHTWSHKNLTRLDASDLALELERSLEWLETLPSSLPWLAYPYGLWNAGVAEAARSAGYAGAFKVDGGWIGPAGSCSRFDLPRLNVPAGISEAGFRLRTAGLLT